MTKDIRVLLALLSLFGASAALAEEPEPAAGEPPAESGLLPRPPKPPPKPGAKPAPKSASRALIEVKPRKKTQAELKALERKLERLMEKIPPREIEIPEIGPKLPEAGSAAESETRKLSDVEKLRKALGGIGAADKVIDGKSRPAQPDAVDAGP